jgi:hypothetical protein
VFSHNVSYTTHPDVAQISQRSSQNRNIESQVKVEDEEQNVAKFLQITEFLYAEKVLYLFTRKNSTVILSMMMSATKNYLAREGEADLVLHE